MIPAEWLSTYERRTNTHQFEQVAPLVAPDALYWFTEGSLRGHDAIRGAFVATWDAIRDERYTLSDVEWPVLEETVAVCTYTFHWRGTVDGMEKAGSGRGTSVLRRIDGSWQIVHEHLSASPD
jgi:ketosteroid isomerase-like protein